jgi:hypothetical protein
MDKVCCEFKRSDGLEVKWIETDDGFRVEVKGDKEKLMEQLKGQGVGCCCVPFGGAQVSFKGGSCC